MADLTVKPTPIQRNEFDVAIELLQLHQSKTATNAEDLPKVFAEYYSLARLLKSSHGETLKPFLPEDIKSKF